MVGDEEGNRARIRERVLEERKFGDGHGRHYQRQPLVLANLNIVLQNGPPQAWRIH